VEADPATAPGTGLPGRCDPVFKDKFSPELVLALFSRSLAQAQPDWPQQTLQPGFVYFDRGGTEDYSELEEFLAAGGAPIVFKLGSTAVHNPGNFYEASAAAARELGRRAVLLGAKQEMLVGWAEVLTLPYAPYSRIFSRAAAIVHQGGSGTTGQALRSGRPQLIVPYGWDQPDNGARLERLGVGLCLTRSAYSAESATTALSRLLTGPSFAARAAEAGARAQCEDALLLACDAIEAVV
jgi:rhamnosyltransferase subunit B